MRVSETVVDTGGALGLGGFCLLAAVSIGIIAGSHVMQRNERARLLQETWAGRREKLLSLAEKVEAGEDLSVRDFAPLDGAAIDIRRAAHAAYRGSISGLYATGEWLGVPLGIDSRKALAEMLRAKASQGQGQHNGE